MTLVLCPCPLKSVKYRPITNKRLSDMHSYKFIREHLQFSKLSDMLLVEFRRQMHSLLAGAFIDDGSRCSWVGACNSVR
jgi:hypothetical protein